MEDNKKDFDDFFRSPDNDRKNHEEEEAKNKDEREEKSSYYSYGPYKSQNSGSSIQSSAEHDVQVTPPRPVRPLDVSSEQKVQQPIATWSTNPPRKRSSFKSTMATILATALVVAGLMVFSDRSNLFSGSQGVLNGSGSSVPASSNTGGGVQGATLDINRPGNIAQIVQNSSPAVVLIETFQKASSSKGSSLLDDPTFRQFFGDYFNNSQQQQQNSSGLTAVGMGSGFIFDKSGYILTNQHVINGADEVHVTVQGNDKPYTAKVLGNSSELDLAVLKIEGDKDFQTLPLASSVDNANVGDWVVAIGNPYGFDHTVTVGVLSAKGREIPISEGQTSRVYRNLMQTDASINPGNSGGPLLNLNGEVIGINTAVSSEAQGIGFAIPINTVQGVLQKLINNEKIPVPYVGVSVQDIAQSYVKDLGLENTKGAIVADVVMSSPAFKGGLKKYDVVTGINGAAVKNKDELVTKIQSSNVGEKLTFNIVRDSKKMDVVVTVGDQNKDAKTSTQQNTQR